MSVILSCQLNPKAEQFVHSIALYIELFALLLCGSGQHTHKNARVDW